MHPHSLALQNNLKVTRNRHENSSWVTTFTNAFACLYLRIILFLSFNYKKI